MAKDRHGQDLEDSDIILNGAALGITLLFVALGYALLLVSLGRTATTPGFPPPGNIEIPAVDPREPPPAGVEGGCEPEEGDETENDGDVGQSETEELKQTLLGQAAKEGTTEVDFSQDPLVVRMPRPVAAGGSRRELPAEGSRALRIDKPTEPTLPDLPEGSPFVDHR